MRFILSLLLITNLNLTAHAFESQDDEDSDTPSSSESTRATSNYAPMTQQQCTPVDLRGERCADGSNRLPALRSQGMTNYCFAFATTELLSYATCRHLSALSTGIQANLQHTTPLKDESNPINLGGNPRDLINTLRSRGPCLESAFPSSPLAIRPDERPKNTPAPSPSGFDFLMSFYNRRNSPNPLNCQSQDIGDFRLNAPLETPLKNESLQQAINTALESRKPVGVHVNSAIAMDNSAPPQERPDQVGTDHYVNIVGRQWINGHCHYLFRDQNSMRGTPWPRVPNNPNQAQTTLSDEDYFYIWIREENLINNIDDVIYQAN